MATLPFRTKTGIDVAPARNGNPTSNHTLTRQGRDRCSMGDTGTSRCLRGRSLQNDRSKSSRQIKAMSKLERRNQAKQRRINLHRSHQQTKSTFAGLTGPARNITVVPLSAGLSSVDSIRQLNTCSGLTTCEKQQYSSITVTVEKFKQRLSFFSGEGTLLDVLDACKISDYVIFVVSTDSTLTDITEHKLRCVLGQGVSNTYVISEEPSDSNTKYRSIILASLQRFLPDLTKIYSLQSQTDCLNLVRSVCTATPKGIQWRDERAWLPIEDIRYNSENETVVTGVIRGAPLNPDCLVQLGNWGTYQIKKVATVYPKGHSTQTRPSMTVEHIDFESQVMPGPDQEELVQLSPEEMIMNENLSDEDFPRENNENVPPDGIGGLGLEHKQQVDKPVRRLPRGTSNYQAAWYIDIESDSGSDLEDVRDINDNDVENKMGYRQLPDIEGTSISNDDLNDDMMPEYEQSEVPTTHVAEDEAENLRVYRSNRKEQENDDLQFPDEIELPPNAMAKDRLSRYLGLENPRTERWPREYDRPFQPAEWNRLLKVMNYKRANSRVVQENTTKGIPVGTRVEIHIKDIPQFLQTQYRRGMPMALYNLFRHEYKWTALNYSIHMSPEQQTPVKSKEAIVVQCGFRRFTINPIFSQAGKTTNDVHLFSRYLHPGQNLVVSFIGPLSWGSIPVLYFQDTSPHTGGDSLQHRPLTLIGTGTTLPSANHRVVAKRVVLTGHPYKINKRVVTVRYMFFNAEDVNHFRSVRLWTRRGRSGHIKESLGTHGYFKTTFDGRINAMDAVAMSLYKRVWPRTSRPFEETYPTDDMALD